MYKRLEAKEIKRIIYLLKSTDMSSEMIAKRMECSKSTVMKVNSDYYVREYTGNGQYWSVGGVKNRIR